MPRPIFHEGFQTLELSDGFSRFGRHVFDEHAHDFEVRSLALAIALWNVGITAFGGFVASVFGLALARFAAASIAADGAASIAADATVRAGGGGSDVGFVHTGPQSRCGGRIA